MHCFMVFCGEILGIEVLLVLNSRFKDMGDGGVGHQINHTANKTV